MTDIIFQIIAIAIGFVMGIIWPNLFAPWVWFNKNKRMKSIINWKKRKVISTEKFDPKMNTLVDYVTIEYSKYVGKQIYDGVPHLMYDDWIKQVPDVLKCGEEYQTYSLDAINKGNIPLTITQWNALKNKP